MEPIACTLTDGEMRERRAMVLDSVRRSVLDITPLPDGYMCRFEATSETLSQLASVVDLERQCRAFLSFRIIVEAGRHPICLEITGPPAAVIADFFDRHLTQPPANRERNVVHRRYA
jgi:hypothetical protein